MKKPLFLLVLLAVVLAHTGLAQSDYTRMIVPVPKVAPSAMTIDGKMDESAWATAGKADLVTSSGFNIFFNPYYRSSLKEPDYDSYYARMLWSQDTLYLFIHIDEFVNDSTNLYWDGQWTGDQLFVGLSNALGMDMKGWYDGNVYAAPTGPYHFLILGDSVTLNLGNPTNIPDEFRAFDADTQRTFDAAKIARWATSINKTTGVWNVEMAIYNPGVAAKNRIGFNIGGSDGSFVSDTTYGDAYAYYCWQPSVVDSPLAQPAGVPVPSWGTDPGYYILATTAAWPLLEFTPGPDDFARKMVDVPKVAPDAITIDGKMNEAAWTSAGKANLVTSSGFEIFFNPYYRSSLKEPDYDAWYARMLWAKETLYVFVHIDEFVNDSTNLYWDGQWTGDQLFLGLSSRLGVDMKGWYDGNVYAAPYGPYHFLILADSLTLNGGNKTNIPEEFRGFEADTQRTFAANDIARWATVINKTTGVWDLEMAIYQPNVSFQARTAFNLGGSDGSFTSDTTYGDAYAYYCWNPSVIDSPLAQPAGVPVPSWGTDPGYYILATSVAWPLLNFVNSGTTGVEVGEAGEMLPTAFALEQNYPNPFNPATSVVFTVPQEAKVEIVVHNILGQKVATLVNERLSAGRHQVRWTASSQASGVYFVQMFADGKPVSARKMLLMK
jgi:hypothetical protein